MYKSRDGQTSHFINTKVVKMMLDAMGKTERQVEEELGWSRTSLKLYFSYKSKLSDERLNQLAVYLHQKPASKLINYNPTKAQIKKYEEEQTRKAQQKQRQKTTISNLSVASDEQIDDLLNLLLNLTKSINSLEQKQRDLSEYVTSKLEEIQGSSSTNNEKVDKLIEINNKHQNYLVGELNKIKLSNHFNR